MSEKKMSINEQMAKLDELLAWFEGENFEIEKAGVKFSEAKKLADAIEQDLAKVKNEITVLAEKFDTES